MNRRRSLLASATTWALCGSARAEWDTGSAVTLPPLTQFDGTPLDAAALKGKVVIVEFWASWCPFCARQNPHIEALYRTHRARGLEVVGVSIDKDSKAAADYMRKHAYTFKAGLATPEWMRIYRLRRGLPQLYVIGRDGRVLRIEQGEMLDDEIRDLAGLL
jgi:thiol-disulfide isomerase/thioredoxin